MRLSDVRRTAFVRQDGVTLKFNAAIWLIETISSGYSGEGRRKNPASPHQPSGQAVAKSRASRPGRSVSSWIDKLRSEEVGSRKWQAAIRGLANLGLPTVFILIEATADGSSSVRIGVAKALAKLGPDVVPHLVKALGHDIGMVRLTAAQVLYGFGASATEAIPALAKALEDQEPMVRQWAATALQNIGFHVGPRAKVAVPALIKALNDKDAVVREWAASALGSIGSSAETATFHLTNALQDQDQAVREAAADAIARIGRGRHRS